MARIDRLDETPRQLLQTASVVGREVPLRVLAALWPQPADLPEQLRTLQNLEFLYEQAGREPGFVFKHALTQDVAYATLLEGRRRALHAAAGQALETLHAGRLEEVYDRLAYHYARTDDAAKAVRYLTGFADRAAGMHAHSDAARALEDALSHVAGLPTGERDQQLVATAVRLAASYYFLGRFRDTVELLEGQRARMEQLGDDTLVGRFFFELAHAHSHLGDYQQAVACAERAIEAAQHAGDPSTQGKAHYVLCKESMWVARFSQGLEHGRRAVSYLEATGERWWLGQSLCWQGINLYFMGDLNAALECAADGFAIGEELGDHRLQSYAAWNHAWFSATRGDGQDAITWGHRSIELSPDPLNNAFSLGWTGYAYLENGDPGRAISLLERSIELLAGMRYSRLVGWFKGWLATAYLLAGDPARARTEATASLEISTSTGFTWAVGLAQRAWPGPAGIGHHRPHRRAPRRGAPLPDRGTADVPGHPVTLRRRPHSSGAGQAGRRGWPARRRRRPPPGGAPASHRARPDNRRCRSGIRWQRHAQRAAEPVAAPFIGSRNNPLHCSLRRSCVANAWVLRMVCPARRP